MPRRFTSKVKKLTYWFIMIAIGMVFIFPFAWMFLTSFKSSFEVFRYATPLTWKTFIPPEPTLENYRQIFIQWHIEKNMLNSVISAVGQMLSTLIVCPLAGFVFSRLQFRGRDLIFGLVMVSAFIPLQVIMVPLYSVMRTLGLVSTYPALFLPFTFSPFGVFLMRQAFMDIPKELDEAASVEGASPFQIFLRVIMPNAKPALATLALIQFMWNWNNFLWPLIIMQDPNKQVVQVAIAKFQAIQNWPLFGEMFAAASVATIPVLVLFLALQRYYVRGMLMSGMK